MPPLGSGSDFISRTVGARFEARERHGHICVLEQSRWLPVRSKWEAGGRRPGEGWAVVSQGGSHGAWPWLRGGAGHWEGQEGS